MDASDVVPHADGAVLADFTRSSGAELVDDPLVLLVDHVGVGLREDRAHHRGHKRLGALGHPGEQVAHEVGAAALP